MKEINSLYLNISGGEKVLKGSDMRRIKAVLCSACEVKASYSNRSNLKCRTNDIRLKLKIEHRDAFLFINLSQGESDVQVR